MQRPPAWKQLISYALNTQGIVSLIAGIFSELNGLDVVTRRREDAKAFVDVVDQVRSRTLQPPRDVSLDTNSNLCVVSNRSWIVSNREFAGEACTTHPGFVPTRLRS